MRKHGSSDHAHTHTECSMRHCTATASPHGVPKRRNTEVTITQRPWQYSLRQHLRQEHGNTGYSKIYYALPWPEPQPGSTQSYESVFSLFFTVSRELYVKGSRQKKTFPSRTIKWDAPPTKKTAEKTRPIRKTGEFYLFTGELKHPQRAKWHPETTCISVYSIQYQWIRNCGQKRFLSFESPYKDKEISVCRPKCCVSLSLSHYRLPLIRD